MLELENLNYLAIIVATLTNVILGSWWYSPAGLGKKWSKMTGVDIMKSPKQETQRAIMAVFASAIVQAFILAVVIKSLGVTNALDGAIVGIALWAGFVAATSLGDALYSRRGWGFWWLNASFFLIIMVVNSLIIAVWN